MTQDDHVTPNSPRTTGSPLDYSAMLEQLKHVAPFDLYRLSCGLGRLLNDPARISAVKRTLRVGDEIQYFDAGRNGCVTARVLRCNRTRATVKNRDDGEIWHIAYCSINTDEVVTQIHERTLVGLGRHEVSVGDCGGFLDRDHREQYGTIVKLNQKTVSVMCDGEDRQWRVGYGLLFRVLDAEHAVNRPQAIQALPLRPISAPG